MPVISSASSEIEIFEDRFFKVLKTTIEKQASSVTNEENDNILVCFQSIFASNSTLKVSVIVINPCQSLLSFRNTVVYEFYGKNRCSKNFR